MMSFKSIHYPPRKKSFLIMQEYAMKYYAIFTFVVMIAVIMRMNSEYNSGDAIYFGLIGEIIALFLGNLVAGVAVRRRVAEVFFVKDGFSVISVHAALTQTPTQSFPLKFANPRLNGDRLEFHYHDQIMVLNREDWGEDFDLIWNWFNPSMPNPFDFVTTTS